MGGSISQAVVNNILKEVVGREDSINPAEKFVDLLVQTNKLMTELALEILAADERERMSKTWWYKEQDFAKSNIN